LLQFKKSAVFGISLISPTFWVTSG